jgi:hypothetical protein
MKQKIHADLQCVKHQKLSDSPRKLKVLKKVLKNAPGEFGQCEETGVKNTPMFQAAMR